jgi:hypothetical protein
MRTGRELSRTALTVLMVLSALVLVIAFAGTGTGLVVIVSVLSSFLVFVFFPLFPRRTAALAVRRVHRGRITRAPPLF